MTVSVIKDPDAKLTAPAYPHAKLRRVREVGHDFLAPAIHSALQIAEAVVRNLEKGVPPPELPPTDGLAWRSQFARPGSAVTLEDILTDLWQRGIPVVPVAELPAPSFQGLACVVDERPVILLGHKHDEPGRVAFWVAHEAKHIAEGDCAPDQPVVEEDEEIVDDADMEKSADEYAIRAVIGGDEIPSIEGTDFRELANSASELERTSGADASTMLFAWARQTGDYSQASFAVKALYRHTGARRTLREHFDRHVDVFAASETDRALLRCIHGDQEFNEASG